MWSRAANWSFWQSVTSSRSKKNCPQCGHALYLVGKSQTLKLRLVCRNCGYKSPLLTQEELEEVL